MASSKRETYPICKKLGLLRTPNGHDHLVPIVVSSAALHNHLGSEGYQEFIRHLHSRGGSWTHPQVGFAPSVVEGWLRERTRSRRSAPRRARSS